MAKRTYRSASGKMVDMDTLALKNETVIAVGNMNINARGDKLGQGGKVVQTREELIAEHYRVKNSLVPEERPLNQKPRAMQETVADNEKDIDDDPMGPLDEPVEPDPEVVQEQQVEEPSAESNDEWVEDPETGDFVKASELDEKKSEPVKPSTRGLAGALAEAKSVDEIPKIKTAKEKARSTKGVKRL